MKRFLTACLVATGLICLLATPVVSALDVPPKPTVPIIDQAQVLSAEQIAALDRKIEAEATQSSNQIGVLIIPSLKGEILEDYSIKVARAWGIGTKDKNNGVLLLVAVQDHALRIEVGYGLEGALPDLQTHRIITSDITPSLKKGDYYQGISNGVDGIIASIHHEYAGSAPIDQPDKPSSHGSLLNFIILPFFGLVWLSSILARSKSWWAGGVAGGVIGIIGALFIGSAVASGLLIGGMILGGLLLDLNVSRNYRRGVANSNRPSWWAGGGGGFFGGGGSGGGGGFGGGGFGGGGSSGDW